MKDLLMASIVLSLQLFTINAFAENERSYHFSSCTKIDWPRASEHGNFWGLGIVNPHYDRDIKILCPMIKENKNGSIKSAWIDVVDDNVTEDISCTLLAEKFEIGMRSKRSFKQTLKTNDASNKWQRLKFESMSSDPERVYAIECTLPKSVIGRSRTSIGNYGMIEH